MATRPAESIAAFVVAAAQFAGRIEGKEKPLAANDLTAFRNS